MKRLYLHVPYEEKLNLITVFRIRFKIIRIQLLDFAKSDSTYK